MSPVRLLLLFLALILYASFYPFQFDGGRFQARMGLPWADILPFVYTGPGDTIANLIAYIPIGIFLRLSLPNRARSFFITVAAGFLLSLSVEILQCATRNRAPSLYDVLMNTISTLIGAALATWVWLRIKPIFEKAKRAHIPTIAVLLGLVWVAMHCAPFVPSFGMHKLRGALSPLKAMVWTLEGSARWLAAWLILSAVVRAFVTRAHFWLALAATALVSLCMRLTFTGHSLSWNELTGLALSLPIVAFAPVLRAPVAALALLVSGLSPYHFTEVPSRIGWIPFVGFMESSWGKIYPVVFEKSYLYAGSVWLLYEAGLSRVAAAVSIAVLLGIVEWMQRYLPGRSPEVSDSLIALMAIVLLERKRQPK